MIGKIKRRVCTACISSGAGDKHARHAFGAAFDTTGQVYGVANSSVIQSVITAQKANHGGAGMDADANVKVGQ